MSPIHFECEGRWRMLSEEVMVGIQEGRLQHPQPTRQEMAFFAPPDPNAFGLAAMPVWAIDPQEEGW